MSFTMEAPESSAARATSDFQVSTLMGIETPCGHPFQRRQEAAYLLRLRHRCMARSRGFGAHVEEVCAFSFEPQGLFHRGSHIASQAVA